MEVRKWGKQADSSEKVLDVRKKKGSKEVFAANAEKVCRKQFLFYQR